MTFLPIPGAGWSKFHMMYDEQSKTYWLLTNEFANSMLNLNKLGDDDVFNGHETNLITFHRVKNFRDLIDTDMVL